MKNFYSIALLVFVLFIASVSSRTALTSETCSFPEVFDAASKTCRACDASSNICIPTGVKAGEDIAVTCKANYYLDAATRQCKACASGCISCVGPTSKDCVTLRPKAYFNSKEEIIADCPANCLRCSERPTLKCDACEKGFLLTAEGTCNKCTNKLCESDCMAAVCPKCPASTYSLKGICTQKEGCELYGESGNCLKCKSNYRLVEDSCYICLYPELKEAFGKYASECGACENSEKTFEQIIKGKKYTIDHVCKSCPANTLLRPDHCYLIQEETKCQTNVSICGGPTCICAPGGNCNCPESTSCVPYYSRRDSGLCQTCPNQCKACKLAENDNLQCTSCTEGFFLSSEKTCEACLPNCVLCDNATECRACGKGFLVVNKQCKRCADGCAECFDLNTCNRCLVGFYLSAGSNKVCKKTCDSPSVATLEILQNPNLDQTGFCGLKCDDANCLKCTVNATTCDSCAAGYQRWWKGGSSQVCIKTGTGACHSSCASCDGDGSNNCLTCQKGLFLDGTTRSCLAECPVGTFNSTAGACEKCIDPGCLRCNATFCEDCDDGFFEKSDGTCGSCSESCQECSGARECDICEQPFLLNYNELEG